MGDSPVSEDLRVQSIYGDYRVRFENDFSKRLAAEVRAGDVMVLDDNVRRLYAHRLDNILSAHKHLVLEATEEQKSYMQLEWILRWLIENGFKKNQRLIAIGGGITQDVTAFIASILYRGVDWLFFPTTLLAQGDSCIGSKTSINFDRYKNQVGTFYPPAEVLIDLEFLGTLPKWAILSGMGEMIHYFLVAGEADFRRMQAEYHLSLQDRAVMRGLIARSLEIKRAFIEKDEFDRAERQVLNYGHSFGHAIESLSNYAIPHGIAVSFGMDIANHLSVKLGFISEELRQDIRQLLAWNWNSYHVQDIEVEGLIAALGKDKKNIGSEIRVILTRGLGQMFKSTLTIDQTMTEWLRAYLQSDGA
jgi:3-dehydroquinate synthase